MDCTPFRHGPWMLAAAICVSLSITGALSQGSTPDYAAIVAASDRSDADRATDKRRDPLPLLSFTGVRIGMKVLDMGAGGGYSTELLARAVGPSGVVYGQNPPEQGARPRGVFEGRTKTPAGQNIMGLWRPFDDPVPADVTGLDLITFFFFYHDTTYLPVDRAAMNRKLYAVLKPGASLVVADHSAKPGEGTSVGKSLHRVEESLVRREIEAAGFKFAAEGNFFRHPEDTRDFTTQPPTKPADEFVMRFEKAK